MEEASNGVTTLKIDSELWLRLMQSQRWGLINQYKSNSTTRAGSKTTETLVNPTSLSIMLSMFRSDIQKFVLSNCLNTALGITRYSFNHAINSAIQE